MSIGKVLVVDDEPKIHTLLKMYLINNKYVVKTVSHGLDALKAIQEEMYDIIVLDILMPHMDGFEVCKKIRKTEGYENIPVIYLSSLRESDSIITGLDSGGDSYLTKPFDPNVLIAKINALLRRTKQKDARNESTSIDEYEKLTGREMQILRWIEKGYTNREIAMELTLTEGTIKVYNHLIYQKLKVKNRTQAIVRANELKILS